jgi:UDP-N-acetylmuramoyl-tripeptide--D-alanyl-D-alanine ligase
MDVVLPCRGEHLAENALAAAAAASVLGASADQIASGLSEAVLPSRRFDVSDIGGFTVIDDTYNANPLSMNAAIASARKIAGKRPLVLVLGEMGELGPESERAHEELGECIARGDCDVVFFKGGKAPHVARGLKSGGFKGDFHPVETPEDFAGKVEEMDVPQGAVLFKGSRSQHMEDFLDRFMAKLREGKR